MTTLLTQPTSLINALTSTSDVSSGAYALPNNNRPIVWQSIIVGSPSAISLQLLGALNNVDAEFAILDTSSSTDGEMRHVSPVNVRFVKVRQVSRTGGTNVTVNVFQ